MRWTKIATLIVLIIGLGTQAYAQEPAKKVKVDPKVLAKAKKDFVKKLGSTTGNIHAKEIPEGFVFKSGKDKLTLLILWTKDCKSCVKDIPNLNRYLLDFRGKLNIIAVELSGMSSQELQQYAKDKKVLYTLVSGAENKAFTSRIMQKFGFKKSLPFQIVLGYTGHNNGIIRGVAKDPAAMEKYLIKIMAHYEKAKTHVVKPMKDNHQAHTNPSTKDHK